MIKSNLAVQWVWKIFMSSSKILKATLYYAIKIILFALLYWLLFVIRPDNFNFTSGYNLRPLSEFSDELYSTDGPNTLTEKDFRAAIAEFQKSTLLLDKYLAVSEVHSSRLTEVEAKIESAFDRLQFSRDNGVSKYILDNIVPLQKQNTEFETELNELPRGTERGVVLARARYNISVEIANHHAYIVKNFGLFSSKEQRDEVENLRNSRSKIISELDKAQRNFREQRSDVHDAFVAARKSITQQIGFFDFLYFSTGVSTTTNFGDIIPNNTWVRMLVTLQIFFGIFLLGYIVSLLIAPKQKNPVKISEEPSEPLEFRELGAFLGAYTPPQ